MGSIISPKNIGKATEIFDAVKTNPTLRSLAERLDGCDAGQAYGVLKSMTDHELRVIAAVIAHGNSKFERPKKGAI